MQRGSGTPPTPGTGPPHRGGRWATYLLHGLSWVWAGCGAAGGFIPRGGVSGSSPRAASCGGGGGARRLIFGAWRGASVGPGKRLLSRATGMVPHPAPYGTTALNTAWEQPNRSPGTGRFGEWVTPQWWGFHRLAAAMGFGSWTAGSGCRASDMLCQRRCPPDSVPPKTPEKTGIDALEVVATAASLPEMLPHPTPVPTASLPPIGVALSSPTARQEGVCGVQGGTPQARSVQKAIWDRPPSITAALTQSKPQPTARGAEPVPSWAQHGRGHMQAGGRDGLPKLGPPW